MCGRSDLPKIFLHQVVTGMQFYVGQKGLEKKCLTYKRQAQE